MNENDLRDLLPSERRLPPTRRRDMQSRLAERIEHDERSSRRRFRLLVGTAAAGLVALAGTAAVLAGGDGRDDDTVTVPVERSVPEASEAARAQDHHPAPTLEAETLACFGPRPVSQPDPNMPGDRWTPGFLFDLPLAGVLTSEDLVAACERGYGVSTGTIDPGGPDDSVDSADPGGPEAEVCTREGRFPSAVVAVDGVTCGDAAADGVELRPMTDADLAELNHMRAVEIALMADPLDCSTAPQSVEHVEGVLDEEDLDLTIRIDRAPMEEAGTGETYDPPPCPRYARVDWSAGEVWVEPFRS